ncbi:MAG: hypothetical protein Q4F84_10005, partial [Fibrobacter sp.]|nr:hypothetical protein [Fibrobacter sp.]
MKSFLKSFFVLLVIFSPLSLRAENSELFWADWIQSAIISRDSFFRNLEINNDVSLNKLNDSQKNFLTEIIDSSDENPWYSLLYG